MPYPVSALTWISFILIAAAYIPRNRIKAMIGHPMVAGVKLWALAHLLSNGRLGDVILFGAFLVWGVFSFRAARARDRASGQTYPAGTWAGDVATLAVGTVTWVAFARYWHMALIGVSPFA